MPTLTDLYRHHTGDTSSHQRTIGAHFARLDARRMRIVAAHMAGKSYTEIGQAEDISRGAAQSVVTDAMVAIHRAIEGRPRYSVPRKLTRKAQR